MNSSTRFLTILSAIAAAPVSLQAATIQLDVTTNNSVGLTLASGDNDFSFSSFNIEYLIVAGGDQVAVSITPERQEAAERVAC